MKDLFHPNSEDIKLTSVLYALSDPIRLNIVHFLENKKELSCNNINIPVPKSTLSHHFKVLRESGIIYVRIDGVHRFLSIRYKDLNSRFPGLIDAILKNS